MSDSNERGTDWEIRYKNWCRRAILEGEKWYLDTDTDQ